MTVEEFMEFYGGTRYVRSNDTRAFLNTDMIIDSLNYRSNIFQLALQHIAHDSAADLISNLVYKDVLKGAFKPVFEKDRRVIDVLDFPSKKWSLHGVTDEDIWRGKGTFPGILQSDSRPVPLFFSCGSVKNATCCSPTSGCVCSGKIKEDPLCDSSTLVFQGSEATQSRIAASFSCGGYGSPLLRRRSRDTALDGSRTGNANTRAAPDSVGVQSYY